MQKIKLSLQQRERLIEMFLFCFPEYKQNITSDCRTIIRINIDNNDMIVYDRRTVMSKILGVRSHSLKIHWFEACLCKIAPALQFTNATFINLRCYNQHPVDVLYEKYKTVKNEKQ